MVRFADGRLSLLFQVLTICLLSACSVRIGSMGNIRGVQSPAANGTPVVSGVSTSTGPTGITVVVIGNGFLEGATVSVSGQVCSTVVVRSSTQLQCTLPTLPTGDLNVVVTNPNSTSSGPFAFAPTPGTGTGTESGTGTGTGSGTGTGTGGGGGASGVAPTVASINPTSGSTAGGTLVTITGTGFSTASPVPTVTIGGLACTHVVVQSATQLQCRTSPNTAQTLEVRVRNNPDNLSGTLPTAYTYVGGISSWSAIDGAPGMLNFNTAKPANRPSSAVVDKGSSATLYAAWTEYNATDNQVVRVSAYPDTETGWTTVDGGGQAGLNVGGAAVDAGTVGLAAYNPGFPDPAENRLYAVWCESGSVKVKAYDGSSWSSVAGAPLTSAVCDMGNHMPAFAVLDNKLYVTIIRAGGNPVWPLAVFSYDGATWREVTEGAGLNFGTSGLRHATYPALVTRGGKLYAFWSENDGAGIYHVRGKVWNGNEVAPVWTSIDNDPRESLNYSLTASAADVTAVEFNGKIYLSWWENVPAAHPYRAHVRVYNGNDSAPAWAFVDGGTADGISTGNVPQATLALFGGDLIFGATSSSIAFYNGLDDMPLWTPMGGVLATAFPRFHTMSGKLYSISNSGSGTNRAHVAAP